MGISLNKEFQRLEKEYFDSLIALSPLTASYLGLHEYDKELDHVNKDSIKKIVDLNSEFVKKFSSFSDEDLHPDQIITRKLLDYEEKLSNFNFYTLKTYEMELDAAQFIGEAIFPLYFGQYGSIEERIGSIIARLNQTERVIDEYKSRVVKYVRLWVEMAIQSVDGTLSFIDTIISSTESIISRELHARLRESAEKAKNHLSNYSKYLKKLLPNANTPFYIGKENFNTLISLRNLGMNVQEIYTLGEDYYRKTSKRLEEISSRLGYSSVSEARDKILSGNFNDFSEIIDFYRNAIEDSKKFVQESKFATVPNKGIKVIETPAYMRHLIPFAAYMQPAKFEDNSEGTYLVTPPENADGLKRFNSFDITNTSIHEAFPGHHLQLSVANMNSSYIRLVAGNAVEFIEGWALYCEEETLNMGFKNELQREFVMLNDLLFRAARIIIDVKLSSGEMTYGEAVKMLMDSTGMEESGAKAEVNRYTQTPGYQLSYLIGKHLLTALINEYRDKGLNNCRIHDELLKNGNLPIFLHREVFERIFSNSYMENEQ